MSPTARYGRSAITSSNSRRAFVLRAACGRCGDVGVEVARAVGAAARHGPRRGPPRAASPARGRASGRASAPPAARVEHAGQAALGEFDRLHRNDGSEHGRQECCPETGELVHEFEHLGGQAPLVVIVSHHGVGDPNLHAQCLDRRGEGRRPCWHRARSRRSSPRSSARRPARETSWPSSASILAAGPLIACPPTIGVTATRAAPYSTCRGFAGAHARHGQDRSDADERIGRADDDAAQAVELRERAMRPCFVGASKADGRDYRLAAQSHEPVLEGEIARRRSPPSCAPDRRTSAPSRASRPDACARSSMTDDSAPPVRRRRVRSMWVARSLSPRRNQVSPPICPRASIMFQLSPRRPQPVSGLSRPARV